MHSIVLFNGEWICRIGFKPLMAVLMEWAPWFAKHGVNLKRHAAAWEEHRHIPIHNVFRENWRTVPQPLRDRMVDLVTLSTPEAQELFIQLAATRKWPLGPTPLGGWSCQDMAARAYIERKDIFNEVMATLAVRDTEDWVDFWDPEQASLAGRITVASQGCFLKDLIQHFDGRQRGKHVRVEVVDVDGSPTLLIAHGDLVHATTNLREKDSVREILRIRPELVDLMRHDAELGRLSIHTRHQPDVEALRKLFGSAFYNDPERFRFCAVYSGDPLIQYGAAVLRHSAEELFKVRVREMVLFRPANPKQWLLFRGADSGEELDHDIKRLVRMGFTGVRRLALAFDFTGERRGLGVEIKRANHLKMPFTLSHADAITGYMIQKTFMKLPNGGGRR